MRKFLKFYLDIILRQLFLSQWNILFLFSDFLWLFRCFESSINLFRKDK